MKILTSAVTLCGLVALAAPAFAGTLAYDQTLQATGNQAYFGSLGMDFQVLTPTLVTAIGVFSNNAFGNLMAAPGTDLNAAIYSISGYDAPSGTLVANTDTTFITDGTYTVDDNWLIQDIAPVLLLPGYYSIVAQGYNSLDENGNNGVGNPPLLSSENGAGLIAFGGSSRYQSPEPGSLSDPPVFPTTIDSNPSNRYYAGDFEFAAATPEPGSMALFGSGFLLVSIGLLGRKRFAR